MLKLLAGAAIALGIAGVGYGVMKSSESDDDLEAERLKTQQLQQQLYYSQLQAQAPVAARPTQEGQNLAGGIASVFDGGVQLFNTLAPLIAAFGN